MNNNDIIFNQTIGSWITSNIWLIVIILMWSAIWKGLALWKAAQNNDKVWFIILLFINTVGILEVLYVFYFGRSRSTKTK